MTDLQELIIRHEGKKLNNRRHMPYKDTKLKLTIGYGRNLDANGISEDEALYLLNNDLYAAMETARGLVPMFDLLTRPRQLVLTSMAYNLGPTGLAGFEKMLMAIKMANYEDAAREMLDSDAARDLPMRYQELAAMMRGNLSTEI